MLTDLPEPTFRIRDLATIIVIDKFTRGGRDRGRRDDRDGVASSCGRSRCRAVVGVVATRFRAKDRVAFHDHRRAVALITFCTMIVLCDVRFRGKSEHHATPRQCHGG
jgi:hypothetical protein